MTRRTGTSRSGVGSSTSVSFATAICDELEIHNAAEESVVYPVIADEVSEDLAQHAEDDDADAKALIIQVRAATTDDELVMLMVRLRPSIDGHVQEEGSEMLHEARRKLDEADFEDLGEKF
jgi:hypothetical protein